LREVYSEAQAEPDTTYPYLKILAASKDATNSSKYVLIELKRFAYYLYLRSVYVVSGSPKAHYTPINIDSQKRKSILIGVYLMHICQDVLNGAYKYSSPYRKLLQNFSGWKISYYRLR